MLQTAVGCVPCGSIFCKALERLAEQIPGDPVASGAVDCHDAELFGVQQIRVRVVEVQHAVERHTCACRDLPQVQ